ncbi:amidohydrolase family protein [Actibacterium sp. MT2.3-13A]|uniref:amidohydrolase family protein n=1 Tax=Actibacterium sp. MT2.3-13A TaxID=2828332 RepID=UPI001BA702F9|nr:amidohydrolase family protein [Actibacterium sp. MT2.3-13A]
MRIDAHQHFWTLNRGDYGWLTPELAPIYRDFTPADLAPLLEAGGIDGTVLVQAAPTVEETRFLLSVAAETEFVRGVVGWVDFEATDAPEQIAALGEDRYLVGLRPMIQDIADPDWILREDLDPAFEAMIAGGLTFDALTLPRHLKNLLARLRRHPDLQVVIDHGSKPLIREGAKKGWAEDMAALARETGAYCKLSGLVSEAGAGWSVGQLRPYTDYLLAQFGPERVIWGSDWPVCTLVASYADWTRATAELLGDLTSEESAAVFGQNAERAYRLAKAE